MGVYGFNDDKSKADLNMMSDWELLAVNSGRWDTSRAINSSRTSIGNISNLVRDYKTVIVALAMTRSSSNTNIPIIAVTEYPTELLRAMGNVDPTKAETHRIEAQGLCYTTDYYDIYAVLEVDSDGAVFLCRSIETTAHQIDNLTNSRAYLFGIKRV